MSVLFFPGLVHSTYILFLPLLHELISVPRVIVWTTSSFFVPHTKQIFFPPQVSTETSVRPGEWIQAFGATGFGIVWLDKRSFWLVNGCVEYHWTIITNFCPPKWLKESLHSKLVLFPLIILVGTRQWTKRIVSTWLCPLLVSCPLHPLHIDTGLAMVMLSRVFPHQAVDMCAFFPRLSPLVFPLGKSLPSDCHSVTGRI